MQCIPTLCFFMFQIAVLDVDICGPSIPKVMGLEGEQVRFSLQGTVVDLRQFGGGGWWSVWFSPVFCLYTRQTVRILNALEVNVNLKAQKNKHTTFTWLLGNNPNGVGSIDS